MSFLWRNIKKNFVFFLVLTLPLWGQTDGDSTNDTPTLDSSIETYDEDFTTSPKKAIYSPRSFDPGYKKKYLKNKSFDYTEKENTQPLENTAPLFNIDFSFLKYLAYPLAIIVVLILLYLLFKNTPIRWEKITRKKPVVVIEDTLESDPTTLSDYKHKIKIAKEKEDYTLATRYYYLWLLQKMIECGELTWHKEKTNKDYLKEIKDINLKEKFKELSYLFDYVYYGKFPVSKTLFSHIEDKFKNAISNYL